MDEEAATETFETYLLRKRVEMGEALARTPAPAERLSGGWAFFYQSRAFVETGDLNDMLVGHGPVVICDDGRIIEGGSLDRDPEALLPR